MAIQGAINSMLGSVSHTIMAYKGYQELQAKKAEKAEKAQAKATTPTPQAPAPQEVARERAEQNVANAVDAKKIQRQKLQESWDRGDFKNLSPKIQGNIKAFLDKEKP